MTCELLSLRELSRRVGISLNEVRRWRDEEDLPVYQTGRRRQAVVWREFEEWLSGRRIHCESKSPNVVNVR